MLIQVFFSVRSERQLMEQVRYNLLYRWFIGLAIDAEAWDHSTFSKNRDRLLENELFATARTKMRAAPSPSSSTQNSRRQPSRAWAGEMSGRSGSSCSVAMNNRREKTVDRRAFGSRGRLVSQALHSIGTSVDR